MIVSTCEYSSLCREFRTIAVDTPDIVPSPRRECSCPSRPLTTICCAPFRRRVSFSDTTTYIETAADHRYRRVTMQDDDPMSPCHENGRELKNKSRERENFDYDIWQADDSSVGRSDDRYSENTSDRIDNYAENPCTFDNDKSQRSHSENIDEQTIENDGCKRKEWSSESDVCLAVRATENKKGEIRKIDDTVSNENLLNHVHKDVDSIIDDEHRMRGGCSGYCCGARDKWVKMLFSCTKWIEFIGAVNIYMNRALFIIFHFL